jgi:predicted ATPase
VGPQGEAAATLLANEVVQTRTRPHVKQISEWLQILGIGKKLEISRVGPTDLFGVDITLEDGQKYPIADLGYGLSQILPVLAQCSFAPPGATLLFEQPELHLHTLAAKPLAKVFIDTYREKGVYSVIETHSPDLFWQFVQELDAGTIKPDDFAAYKVVRRDKQSVFELIEIAEDFEVYERWESGISA